MRDDVLNINPIVSEFDKSKHSQVVAANVYYPPSILVLKAVYRAEHFTELFGSFKFTSLQYIVGIFDCC